jgi:hypothetical protein
VFLIAVLLQNFLSGTGGPMKTLRMAVVLPKIRTGRLLDASLHVDFCIRMLNLVRWSVSVVVMITEYIFFYRGFPSKLTLSLLMSYI